MGSNKYGASLPASLLLGCLLGSAGVAAKSPHKLKAEFELQFRSNSNVSVAPASGGGFDFADQGDFDDPDEAAPEDEDEDSDDGFDEDGFDDLVDADLSEDEIEEDDAFDEDGDGIDDLIDPNADTVVDKENRVSAKLAVSHRYQLASPNWGWTNSVRLVQDRHNQRSDLDKFNWALSTGLEFKPKDSPHQFRPSLSYVTIAKDSETFASTFVVSLAYRYEWSKQLTLGATYNYQDKDISDAAAPDSQIDTLALTADLKLTADDILKFKLAPKVEDSTKVTRNTDASGWELTYSRKLPWDTVLGLGFKSSTTEYRNLDPRREDDNDTWAVQIDKDFSKRWSMTLGYETRERQSNIEGKDAENDSWYLTTAWKF